MSKQRTVVELDEEKEGKKKQPIVQTGFSLPSWRQIKWSALLFAVLTLAFFALGGLIGGLDGVWKDAGEFFLDWIAEKTWWMTGIKLAAPLTSLLVTVLVNIAVCYQGWGSLFSSAESSKPDEGKTLKGEEPEKKSENDLKSAPVLGATQPTNDPAPLTPDQQALATKSIWR